MEGKEGKKKKKDHYARTIKSKVDPRDIADLREFASDLASRGNPHFQVMDQGVRHDSE